MYSLKSVSGETRFGRNLPISRNALLVTMLSSMFCVTRVSPRSKKITLARFAILGNFVPSTCKDLGLFVGGGWNSRVLGLNPGIGYSRVARRNYFWVFS